MTAKKELHIKDEFGPKLGPKQRRAAMKWRLQFTL
jgi:hypothetical protein